jgi:hypothetical protein
MGASVQGTPRRVRAADSTVAHLERVRAFRAVGIPSYASSSRRCRAAGIDGRALHGDDGRGLPPPRPCGGHDRARPPPGAPRRAVDHARTRPGWISLSDRLDARELAARTARAVDTAVSTGRELGLNVREAQVLHDAFCVVLRLAPAPVVVRVPVVVMYGSDLAALRARQVREIAVADWLARSEARRSLSRCRLRESGSSRAHSLAGAAACSGP